MLSKLSTLSLVELSHILGENKVQPIQPPDRLVKLDAYKAKSLRSRPTSQRGVLPRPLQVAPDIGSTYLAATARDCGRDILTRRR